MRSTRYTGDTKVPMSKDYCLVLEKAQGIDVHNENDSVGQKGLHAGDHRAAEEHGDTLRTPAAYGAV